MRESPTPLAALGALFATILLAACAPASTNSVMRTPERPMSTTIETQTGSHTVDIRNSAASLGADLPMPIEQTWLALPKVYDEIGLTRGGSTTPEGHTYGVMNKRIARIAGKPLNTYLDCGDGIDGPRANLYDVRVSILTSLTEKEGGTHVETLVQAMAKPRGVSGNAVTCRSRATLEALIAERLAGRAG